MKTQNTLSKFLIIVIIITSIGVIPTKKIMASSTTKNITAGTETISGSAYGSTDIIINSTQQVNIVIYKKGIFSSKKLKSVKNKKKYKYNIKINKDKENNLYKNSIVKTDHIYKLNKKDILKKVGKIDSDMIKLFESKYEEYSNEKSFVRWLCK